MATKAKIQYCVRWDASSSTITAEQRKKLETVLSTQYNKWVSKALAGFDGFPYESVDVSISGWAANNTALLEGDTPGLTIHTDTADVDYMLENLDADNIHILLHEIGHTYGLDDFYDWQPTGQDSFIMMAGSATEITDFDAWMARDWWRHIKSRYSL